MLDNFVRGGRKRACMALRMSVYTTDGLGGDGEAGLLEPLVLRLEFRLWRRRGLVSVRSPGPGTPVRRVSGKIVCYACRRP